MSVQKNEKFPSAQIWIIFEVVSIASHPIMPPMPMVVSGLQLSVRRKNTTNIKLPCELII
jgi:hypothetical protein